MIKGTMSMIKDYFDALPVYEASYVDHLDLSLNL